MRVFTIGYGGLAPTALVSELKERSVQSVVDIRIWPIRASMGSYVLAKSKERGIQGLLARNAISYYSFLELGNPYRELPDWKERYRKLIGAAGDLLTERLTALPDPICLLCSEKHPDECHRLIVAELLEQRGHEVQHIIEDAAAPRRRGTGNSPPPISRRHPGP